MGIMEKNMETTKAYLRRIFLGDFVFWLLVFGYDADLSYAS